MTESNELKEQGNTLELRPMRHGKSTMVDISFASACKRGESAKYEHPDYVCYSRKALLDLIQQREAEAVQKDRDKVVPLLTDIGYTLEVMEDYIIDKRNDMIKQHFYHIKWQMRAVLYRLAEGGNV